MKIDWEFPQPRKGLAGEWDKLIGPGATKSEVWIMVAFAILAAIAAPLYAVASGLQWGFWQLLFAGLSALDLTGGIFTNSTSAAKRWYHRAGHGRWHRFGFVALHALYIFMVAFLYRDMDWGYFFSLTLYLLGGTAIILWIPLYLQRPVAMTVFAFSIPFSLYIIQPTPGLEWFIPFLFLKLMVGHAVREEPYQPERNA
jgi:hypothetical protein